MNNLIMQRLQFKQIGAIFYAGWVDFKHNLWLNLLFAIVFSLITIPLWYVLLMLNSQLSLVISFLVVFLMVNLLFASLLINNKFKRHLHGAYFKYYINYFSQFNLLPLIIVLSVIEVLPNLVSLLFMAGANYSVQYFILQLIMLIFSIVGIFALIINVLNSVEHRPFHVLRHSIKFITNNFLVLLVIYVITVIMFILINYLCFSGITLLHYNSPNMPFANSIFTVALIIYFIVNLIFMLCSLFIAVNCIKINFKE